MRNCLKSAGYILGAVLATFLGFGVSIAAFTGGTTYVGTANETVTALVEGAAARFSFDLSNNLRVAIPCIAGESYCDSTSPGDTSYIMTRSVMLSSGEKTTDAQIKASAGYVSHLICQGTDAAVAAGGTIILYDSLTETGTAVYTLRTTTAVDYRLPMYIPIGVKFATGIYLGYATATELNCHVFYY